MPPLAASQGYPWDEAVRDGLELLVPNQICARVSVKRMNDLMKESRDMMFSHEIFPQRVLLGAPFRCISPMDGWKGYIANHDHRNFIVGPGICWAGFVAFLDEDDINHRVNVVDLVLVCFDGTIVRMHPRVAANRAPVGIRVGRFHGHFREFVEYDWSASKVRPMEPPANPQPIAALQTLASPQGASSSTDVRPIRPLHPPPQPAAYKALPTPQPPPPWKALPTPKPPPSRQPRRISLLQGDPPQPVLYTNGVFCLLTSQEDMPSATVPVWPDRNCPAAQDYIASVPHPWVPYHCPYSMRIWIHNSEASTWAWWGPSSLVAQ